MGISNINTFHVPTKIIKGLGSLEKLGTELKTFNTKKAFIVTGKNIVKVGLAKKVEEILNTSNIETQVFDEVMPDPTVELVEKGSKVVKEGNFDTIIGLGGGSNIDAAKAIAVLATNPHKITDYEGSDKFSIPPLPIIAIPTTAGTGSEVTYSSVITDTERDYKFVVWSSLIAPRLAILDPTTITTSPRIVRIAAGMDALTHAIESYLSKIANPYSEALAISAIRHISEYFRIAVADPHNITAVSHMQIAANMAGMAFTSTRLGIVHALALPPSALFHVPHGIANAILLPHGMEFNLIANPKKFVNIARAMGENTEGHRLMESAMLAVDAVVELADDIGAPVNLESVGVKQESLEQMAKDSMKSGHIAVNPREVTLEDAINILSKAF